MFSVTSQGRKVLVRERRQTSKGRVHSYLSRSFLLPLIWLSPNIYPPVTAHNSTDAMCQQSVCVCGVCLRVCKHVCTPFNQNKVGMVPSNPYPLKVRYLTVYTPNRGFQKVVSFQLLSFCFPLHPPVTRTLPLLLLSSLCSLPVFFLPSLSQRLLKGITPEASFGSQRDGLVTNAV